MDKNTNNSNITDKTKNDVNRQIDEELHRGRNISQGNLTTDPGGGSIASDIFAAASNVAKNTSQNIEDKYDFGPKGMPSRNFGKNTPSDQGQTQPSLISNPLERQGSWNDQRAHNEAVPEGLADARTVGNIEAQERRLSGQNPNSLETQDVAYGYNKYRTSSDSLQHMGQVAKDLATSGYEQSDAKQGYNHIRHGYSLAGGALIGNAIKGSSKYKSNNDFYNYGSLNSSGGFGADRRINQLYKTEVENHIAMSGTGPDMLFGRQNTGNVQRDFSQQKARIIHQLEAKKINARTLNSKDIANAIQSGELNGIKLDHETRLALFEYHNLVKMEPNMNVGGGFGKGLSDQTKLLIKESIKDSDAYTGIKTVSSSLKAGKTAVKATRVGSSLAVSSAVSAITGVGNVSAKAIEKYSTRKFGKTGDVKWKVRAEAAKSTSIKITDGKNKVKYTARDFRKNGVTGMVKNRLDKTAVGRGLSNLRDSFYKSRLISRINGVKSKLLGAKSAKVLTAPFRGLGVIGAFVKKWGLIIGGVGLGLIVLEMFIIMGINAFMPTGIDLPNEVDNPTAPHSEFSFFAQAMDYVYQYKKAYETNIYTFEAGSPESKYGLLPGWGLYDYLAENIGFSSDPEWQSVNESPTATKKDGYPEAESNVKSFSEDFINGDEENEVVGYNLHKYWGTKTFDYNTVAKWTITEEQMVGDHMESDTIRIYEGDISLLSTAGVLGKGNKLGNFYGRELGEWVYVGQHSGGTNKFGHEITIFEYKLQTKLDEESDGYKKRPERALDYTDYLYNKVYTGAQFSEYYVKKEYREAYRLEKDPDTGDKTKATGEEFIIDTDYFFKDDEHGMYYYQQGRKKNQGDYYAAHYSGSSANDWLYKGTMPSRGYFDTPNMVVSVVKPRDPELENTNFELTPYYEADLFKNMISLCVGIVHNSDECQEFKNAYTLQLYKKIAQAEYAKEDFDDIRHEYTPDERNIFLCTYPKGSGNMHVFSPKIVKSGAGQFEENHPEAYVYCPGHPNAAVTIDVAAPPDTMDPLEDLEDVEISYSWFSKGLLEIRYWDCGIQDMMRLDMSKNIADDDLEIVDNIYVHKRENHNEEHYDKAQMDPASTSYAYEVNDPASENYTVWDGFPVNADGVIEIDESIPATETYYGWFTPEGGLTQQHSFVFDFSQYSIMDWEMMYEDFTFPDEFGYLLTSITDILTGSEQLDPEVRDNILYQVIEEFAGTKTTKSLSKPLTEAEKNNILKNLTGLTIAQKEVVKLALDAIGKIGYQWGGKASGPGWGAKFGSSTPDSKKRANGLDCSGFVQWVYKTVTGKTMPTGTSGYGTKPKIQYSQLKVGDVGLLRTPGAEDNHIGIYIGKSSSGEDLWVHCSGSKGVTLSYGYGFKQFYSMQ